MHIFLIRHGESVANVGENYVKRLPDHLVSLTDKGKEQAYKQGVWLKEYCDKNGIDLGSARIWRSPYLRTRQTSEEFNKSLGIEDIREDITLIEQQFGLFDSLPEEEWARYEIEYDEFLRQVQNHGKFYARLPLGESPFDVAIRIHQFMGTIHRDLEKDGSPNTLFVFTHGTTLRTFLMRWFHYSPEWYEQEKNPKNCWIREIINDKDLGYINKDV